MLYKTTTYNSKDRFWNLVVWQLVQRFNVISNDNLGGGCSTDIRTVIFDTMYHLEKKIIFLDHIF